MVLRFVMVALFLTIGHEAQMVMVFGSFSLYIVIRVIRGIAHNLSVVFFSDSTVMLIVDAPFVH